MKLVIENYIENEDILILGISSIFSKKIMFKNIQYEKGNASTDFNLNNTIIKISINPKNQKEKKFNFYDENNKLVYKHIGSECFIKIYDNKIVNFDDTEFGKLRSGLVTSHNKSVIGLWNNYWYYLHWLCYNYPKNPNSEDKKQIINLVTTMRTTGIKCGKCKGHFDQWLKKKDINPYLESQEKLFEYFFVLHNDVNERNKKKIFTLEEAIALFRDKDWTKYFKDFEVNIMDLFKTRKLGTFPNLFYTKVDRNLKRITGNTKIIENLRSLEKKPIDSSSNDSLIIKDDTKLEGIVLKKENKIPMMVKQGWNLIGAVKNGKMRNMNIEDYLIFEFDERYKKVSEMKEGKGYWIKCINDGIIEYE